MMYDIGMKHLLIQSIFFVRHMFFDDVDNDTFFTCPWDPLDQ